MMSLAGNPDMTTDLKLNSEYIYSGLILGPYTEHYYKTKVTIKRDGRSYTGLIKVGKSEVTFTAQEQEVTEKGKIIQSSVFPLPSSSEPDLEVYFTALVSDQTLKGLVHLPNNRELSIILKRIL